MVWMGGKQVGQGFDMDGTLMKTIISICVNLSGAKPKDGGMRG